MKVKKTSIDGAFLIEVDKYEDGRGFFIESWNEKDFLLPHFVQDNHTRSKRGVLRGLHYQVSPTCQGKLIRCISGSVYDVIVDMREKSSTFSNWFGIKLDRPELQLWAPPGMAHGFYTLSDMADFHYKVTDYYDQSSEQVLFWNDSTIGIDWPFDQLPILSKKDVEQAKKFEECPKI